MQGHIAIVEDHAPLCEMLGAYLVQHGFQVTGFGSAGAFLDWLAGQCQPPELLLLVVGLPDRDGLALAAEVRQLYPSVRIVILTGHSDAGSRIAGWGAGADAVLTKPVHPPELLAVIDRCLDLTRWSRVAKTRP